MADQYLPRTLTITVTSGSGSVTIPNEYSGVCIGVSIRPADTAYVYDFEVFDSESFGQVGGAQCTGNATIREEFQVHAGGSIDITNATGDGAYLIRLWYKE